MTYDNEAIVRHAYHTAEGSVGPEFDMLTSEQCSP